MISTMLMLIVGGGRLRADCEEAVAVEVDCARVPLLDNTVAPTAAWAGEASTYPPRLVDATPPAPTRLGKGRPSRKLPAFSGSTEALCQPFPKSPNSSQSSSQTADPTASILPPLLPPASGVVPDKEITEPVFLTLTVSQASSPASSQIAQPNHSLPPLLLRSDRATFIA